MSVEEKKSAKKISILDSAYKLFLGRGVNMTAIDDVVKSAGVAKGTFYLYFKDKYDLLEQILISKSEIIFKSVASCLEDTLKSPDVSAADKIIAFTDCLIDRLICNRGLVTLIQTNTSAFYTFWFSGDSPIINEYIKRTDGDYVSRETAESLMKGMYVLSAAMLSVCCNSILYEKPYTVDEIKPQIHSMIRSIAEAQDFRRKEVRDNEKIG